MMTNTQISNMLQVMSEMTKEACKGTNFVEISTYVKNHVPGITPEFVEVFRDMITPIVHEHHTKYRYILVTYEYGIKNVHDYGHSRKACLDEADSYIGDNGFAYIYTTDGSVPDRSSYEGGTYYFDTEEELFQELHNPTPQDDEW